MFQEEGPASTKAWRWGQWLLCGDQNVRQGGGTQTQRDQIREVDWDLGCWVRCSLGDREPCKMLEQRRDLSRGGLLVGYLEGKSGHKKR